MPTPRLDLSGHLELRSLRPKDYWEFARTFYGQWRCGRPQTAKSRYRLNGAIEKIKKGLLLYMRIGRLLQKAVDADLKRLHLVTVTNL
jgi:hypothetical protein